MNRPEKFKELAACEEGHKKRADMWAERCQTMRNENDKLQKENEELIKENDDLEARVYELTDRWERATKDLSEATKSLALANAELQKYKQRCVCGWQVCSDKNMGNAYMISF